MSMKKYRSLIVVVLLASLSVLSEGGESKGKGNGTSQDSPKGKGSEKGGKPFEGLFGGVVPVPSASETPEETYKRLLDASLRRSLSQDQYDLALQREQTRKTKVKNGKK